MKWYTGPEGDQRIWYEADEIEELMSEQLRKARQRLTLTNPAPDLESFVENHLQVDLDQYATLDEDVLGLTEFNGSQSPRMKISATLTEAADSEPPLPGMRGRWRATIAHEASHVVLHRYLFDPAMVSIRQGDVRDPIESSALTGELKRMQCLHRDIEVAPNLQSRTTRDWREVQANRGMAALLMPESIFKRVAAMNGGVKGSLADGSEGGGAALIAAIASSFEVSRQAATYRLQGFGFLA
jgi:hypothetical protein